jgi:hypothetical protein
MNSDIDPKHIIKVPLHEISEEQREVFEAHRMAAKGCRKADEA